uniref:Ovule protein n=1 Tax=Caenorhabditis tropicalis TaxID=1561998 RepID=A0A1I7U7S7_9PELO
MGMMEREVIKKKGKGEEKEVFEKVDMTRIRQQKTERRAFVAHHTISGKQKKGSLKEEASGIYYESLSE